MELFLMIIAYLEAMLLARIIGRVAFVLSMNAYRKWKINRVCDDDTCCCGAPMEGHSFYDNHSPLSMREYAISCSMLKY